MSVQVYATAVAEEMIGLLGLSQGTRVPSQPLQYP